MKNPPIRMSAQVKSRICAGFVALTLMGLLIVGCATEGNIRSSSVAKQTAKAKGSSVDRLADGRDGFVISEVPKMSETSRKNFERAVALLNDEKYDQAISLLEKIIEQSPGVSAPYINIGIAYQRTGKPEQAEKHLKTALELVPAHPVACNEYALLCRKSGRFDEARALYEKAVAVFPDYYPVHRNLGILCDLYQNDLACALKHYEIYSQAFPEDKQVKMWIADLKNRTGSH